jgi:rod shape-determining protein MreD
VRFLATWGLRLALLVVLQVGLGNHLKIEQVKPDFFLLSVLLVAMGRGCSAAIVWGIVAGLVQDVLSAGIIGFNVLTKPALGYGVGLLRSRLDFDNPNTQTLLTLLATLSEGAVLSMMLYAYHPANSFSTSFTTIFVPGAVYNAIIIPLAAPSARLVKHHFSGWRRRVARQTV